uniref:DNA helicase MCM9 n=1 Tax=Ciona intestinalis TaxID=7719 RepID=UPI000180B14C|nr:DNA helicase MCM9 [Ciona intestinalis]|eukprot:XP_002131219.1 DNA helicase MCM9 [Ciona intestinalis]
MSREPFALVHCYVTEHHTPDVIRILLEQEDNAHYSVTIDGCRLLESHEVLGEVLLLNSNKMLEILDNVLLLLMRDITMTHSLKSHMSIKRNIHARFVKLPRCLELCRDRIPKSNDIGNFLAVQGTVIRTSTTKILECKKEYMCCKCNNVFTLDAEFQLHYTIPTPTKCPVDKDCNSKKFVLIGDASLACPSRCIDYQEVKVQEQIRKLSMGTIPRSITVALENDLVDCCKAGDDVVVFGAVSCRWQGLNLNKPCELELVIKANNVCVCNNEASVGDVQNEYDDEFQCFWAAYVDTPMTARNIVLESVCPQVYGLYVVKLAVALILAGGVARTDASGSRVRGECHLLLVGDPGTGKSQFLKYASRITRRSVLTTGIGSSTAGLTVSAVRDGAHWMLEAGALVLADGGICCVDEFAGIKEHDRSAIHEAMEQQTISVAKAGLVCKLNTRTSILAATNPKLGKYDECVSVETNIAMASPLLSRFDLILVLLDSKNISWDDVVADYLLNKTNVKQTRSKVWSLQQMQAYFTTIRQLTPTLTHEADLVLKNYYQAHRKSNSRNAARTTLRLLESLIRLAEAHAKIMFRSQVLIQDAVAAITVMESSMQGASLLTTGSILHSCFPQNAEEEYLKHSRLVLDKLELGHLLHAPPPHNTHAEHFATFPNISCSAIPTKHENNLNKILNLPPTPNKVITSTQTMDPMTPKHDSPNKSENIFNIQQFNEDDFIFTFEDEPKVVSTTSNSTSPARKVSKLSLPFTLDESVVEDIYDEDGTKLFKF